MLLKGKRICERSVAEIIQGSLRKKFNSAIYLLVICLCAVKKRDSTGADIFMSQNNYRLTRVILDCERMMTLSRRRVDNDITDRNTSLPAFHEGLLKDDLINYVRAGVSWSLMPVIIN